MSLKRIGNPKYRKGVDSLGRRSWKLRHNRDYVDVRGLRSGLVDDAPVSAFNSQLSPNEMREVSRDFERPTSNWYQEVFSPRELKTAGAAAAVMGAGSAAVLGAVSGSAVAGLAIFFAAPVALVGGAAFLWEKLYKGRFMGRAVRKRAEGLRGIPSRKRFIKEGREMVQRFSHFAGKQTPFRHEEISNKKFAAYRVVSTVSEDGLGEIKWEESSRGEGAISGSLFLYPGANIERSRPSFPVIVPGVNLRGAVLQGAAFVDGCNFDGADLRGVSARGVTWEGSLQNANFSGAYLVGVNLHNSNIDGCDLSGADVFGAKLPRDLRRVNITGKQLDSLRGMGEYDHGQPYIVREVTVDDLVGKFGADRDEVTVSLWAGDVEVRSRKTNKVVVSGGFDAAEHYIPYWVAE